MQLMIRYWKNKGKKDNEIKGTCLENMVDAKVAICRTYEILYLFVIKEREVRDYKDYDKYKKV